MGNRVQQNNKYNYNPFAFIHFLRFFGAISIAAIFHSVITVFPDGTFLYSFLKQHAKLFVEMFLLISGLMFAVNYYPKLLNKKMTYNDLIINRCIRFYPIAIFTTLYIFFFSFSIYKIQGKLVGDLNAFDFIVSLLLINTKPMGGPGLNGPLWCISVIILCYVVASFIIFVLSKTKSHKKCIWPFIIPIFIGFVLYVIFKKYIFSNYYWDRIPRAFICFFLGFLLPTIYRRISPILLNKSKKKIIVKLVVLAYLISFILLLRCDVVDDQTPFWDYSLSFGVGFFPFLFFLCYDTKWLNIICSTKFIKFLGAISMGIYAFNTSVLLTIQTLWLPYAQSIGVWYLPLLMFIHIAVASIWYLSEKSVKKIIRNKIGKD